MSPPRTPVFSPRGRVCFYPLLLTTLIACVLVSRSTCSGVVFACATKGRIQSQTVGESESASGEDLAAAHGTLSADSLTHRKQAVVAFYRALVRQGLNPAWLSRLRSALLTNLHKTAATNSGQEMKNPGIDLEVRSRPTADVEDGTLLSPFVVAYSILTLPAYLPHSIYAYATGGKSIAGATTDFDFAHRLAFAQITGDHGCFEVLAWLMLVVYIGGIVIPSCYWYECARSAKERRVIDRAHQGAALVRARFMVLERLRLVGEAGGLREVPRADDGDISAADRTRKLRNRSRSRSSSRRRHSDTESAAARRRPGRRGGD